MNGGKTEQPRYPPVNGGKPEQPRLDSDPHPCQDHLCPHHCGRAWGGFRPGERVHVSMNVGADMVSMTVLYLREDVRLELQDDAGKRFSAGPGVLKKIPSEVPEAVGVTAAAAAAEAKATQDAAAAGAAAGALAAVLNPAARTFVPSTTTGSGQDGQGATGSSMGVGAAGVSAGKGGGIPVGKGSAFARATADAADKARKLRKNIEDAEELFEYNVPNAAARARAVSEPTFNSGGGSDNIEYPNPLMP